MNSTPTRYETIFGEQTAAPSPGFDIDETVIEPSSTARDFGPQKAQPEIFSHTGRPGIEYLVTAECILWRTKHDRSTGAGAELESDT